jgi:hypothetical protein
MESMDGSERVADFIAAYEKLIDLLQAGGKRRILLVPPAPPPNYVSGKAGDQFASYDKAVKTLATQHRFPALPYFGGIGLNTAMGGARHRDGIHLNAKGQSALAMYITMILPQYQNVSTVHNPPTPDTYVPPPPAVRIGADGVAMADAREESLRQAIIAKHRLWERYRRPQNWAFLAGDRVSQPSSRDWRDPNKRWFPEEMEQFVPLIEQKEKEIWDLAARLKAEGK